jgi:hypothetical protein
MVHGVVSRPAMQRNDRDGNPMANFAVKTTIHGTPGDVTTEIFVSHSDLGVCDGRIAVGSRIELRGVLTFRKKGEAIYLNMTATEINTAPTEASDCIDGSMEMRGTLGKQIEMRTDRKGGSYLTFSAFSTEMRGSEYEYLWVRFVRFSDVREAFIQPKAKIVARGKLEVSAYQGRICLGCRLESISERETVPFGQSDNSKNEPPF